VGTQNLFRIVWAAVIHHNQLEITKLLEKNGFKRLADELPVIVGGNDDGNLGHRRETLGIFRPQMCRLSNFFNND
jgi:hypothetical protein